MVERNRLQLLWQRLKVEQIQKMQNDSIIACVSIIVGFKKRILRNTNSTVKNLHNYISHWPNFTKYIPSLKWKILYVKFLCRVLSLTHASVYSIHLIMPQLIHLSNFTAFHVSKSVCDKNANKG